jgi:hypothetical protein
MKNIIYAILLVIIGFGLKYLVDYPVILSIVATFWCVLGAIFLYNIIDYLLNKTTK